MPDLRPSSLEPGTPNYPGIAGLCAGIAFVVEQGVENLSKIRMELVRHLAGYLGPAGYSVHSVDADENPCGIVSFCRKGWSCEDIGYVLNHSYDIRIRTGLHCAPLIHKDLGTYPDGTVRVSFSPFNTHEEVDTLIEALETIRGCK